MKLKEIKTKTLSDKVKEEILTAIKESGLKPGDSLPGELEFAEKLGVSRSVIRDAVTRLRTLGIVESKKKRGLVLCEPALTTGIKEVINLPLFSHSTTEELCQLRLIIECGLSEFVFSGKTTRLLAELEKIVEYEETHHLSHNETIDQEIKFHCKLYEMTGNRTLSSLQDLLVNFFTEKANSRNPKSDINHRNLLECLKHGTVREFRELMHNHLQPYMETHTNV